MKLFLLLLFVWGTAWADPPKEVPREPTKTEQAESRKEQAKVNKEKARQARIKRGRFFDRINNLGG